MTWTPRLRLAALGVAAALTAGGCDGGSVADRPAAAATPAAAPAAADVAPARPVTLRVTPADGASGVPVAAEIGLTATGGTVTDVALREAGGRAVPGALRDDRSAWVPDRPLEFGRRYEARVTATGAAGEARTVTAGFTTMARPRRTTGTGLYLFDGKTYGVAMPVVAEFSPGVRPADRARVQRRMFVTTDPPQPGVWSWTPSGTQAYYRAREYWKPGTTLKVRLGLAGLPTGKGRYGDRDRAATARIGRALVMTVENSTKTMTVTENGRTVRTLPVSLGKKSTPSSSGTMVVMEKKASTVFDTRAELGPQEGYRIDIDYAQRITWSGQYIHSAPWSVGDQGRRNVSHGCVNVSPANARWLFGRTMVGDPITVRGTGVRLEAGNGWTAWNQDWEQFVKGSALPPP